MQIIINTVVVQTFAFALLKFTLTLSLIPLLSYSLSIKKVFFTIGWRYYDVLSALKIGIFPAKSLP